MIQGGIRNEGGNQNRRVPVVSRWPAAVIIAPQTPSKSNAARTFFFSPVFFAQYTLHEGIQGKYMNCKKVVIRKVVTTPQTQTQTHSATLSSFLTFCS